jgi:nucleoside-diphosphate-sugar epimerase
MKIYIIGSTGFIGQNLVQRYKNEEVFEHKRYHDLLGKLEWFKPDVIINCAAEIYEPSKMFNINVGLVKDCLDWCDQQGNKTQFIQLGSSSEYGTVNRATHECDPIVADNMYSATKGAATLFCQAYGRQHNVDVQVIRPYSPYGPGERPHRLFPALWRAFKLDRPMTLAMGVHDFCYIDDFVAAVDLVIGNDKRIPGEVLNVSSGVQYSNSEVLETFRKITGIQGNVELTAKITTPAVWRADLGYIKQKYGWTPKTSLEDGIRKFLEEAKYE